MEVLQISAQFLIIIYNKSLFHFFSPPPPSPPEKTQDWWSAKLKCQGTHLTRLIGPTFFFEVRSQIHICTVYTNIEHLEKVKNI